MQGGSPMALRLVLSWHVHGSSLILVTLLSQMCVATLDGIKYFLLLLAVALMGFGTAFFLLFRAEAAAASLTPDGKPFHLPLQCPLP